MAPEDMPRSKIQNLKSRTRRLAFLLLLPAGLGLGGPQILSVPSTMVYPTFWHTPLGIHKGTPSLLKMFVGDQTYFSDPKGLACTHLAEYGKENSNQLTVVGVNSGMACLVYNPDFASLKVFGSFGPGIGQFDHPTGAAILPDGRVAIGDTGNHRVVMLRLSRGLLSWTGTLGHLGSGPGEFNGPTWVAFDSQGRLYVSDTGNNRVQVFSPEGLFQMEFGGDPSLENSLIQPQGIAVCDSREPFAAAREDAIFVVDQYCSRVQKFDFQGRLRALAQASDVGHLVVTFSSLALDYFNNVWVADMGNHQIHKLDHQLQPLDSWGSKGDDDGQFHSPRGIAIYRQFGQILVAEAQSAQYLWVGSDVKNIQLSSQVQASGLRYMRFDFFLTEKSWVQARLEDAGGRLARTLLGRGVLPQGANVIYWDGNTQEGFHAPPATYTLVIQAEATYASATYYAKQVRRQFVLK